MKRTYFLATTVALLFMATLSYAEKVKEVSGNLNILKGITKLNVQYDYSHLDVGKKSEGEYVKEKKDSYNEKEAGKGDKWAANWVADRKSRFEPRFEQEFNKISEPMKVGSNPNEKYTMIIKTLFIEPGYNVGITRKNAYIDVEVWIVETANPTNVVAKLTCEDCPGGTFGGFDFDSGERLKESYATAAKGLAKYFNKNIE